MGLYRWGKRYGKVEGLVKVGLMAEMYKIDKNDDYYFIFTFILPYFFVRLEVESRGGVAYRGKGRAKVTLQTRGDNRHGKWDRFWRGVKLMVWPLVADGLVA